MVKEILKKTFYIITYKISFILYIFNKFFRKKKLGSINTILVIKPDALGDYILVRDYIRSLKKNYSRIVLVGNKRYKHLADFYDSDVIDQFFWIDINRFYHKFFYRIKLLCYFHSISVDTLIYPSYSREGPKLEDIIRAVSAKIKMAWYGDLQNQSYQERKETAFNYTHLLNSESPILFEFERNKKFFEELLRKKISLEKPNIASNTLIDNMEFSEFEPYSIIFIGAAASFRRWSIEYFATVAKFIADSYHLQIVISGGPDDVLQGKGLESLLGNRCINLVGKTTLPQLVSLIAKSKLILSNETGIPHIAVATGNTNIFVISNGNHYGRFTPYPDYICSDYYGIYPPDLESLPSEEDKYLKYGCGSSLNIESITPQYVIRKIVDNVQL